MTAIMNGWMKLGIVVAGYVLAMAASGAAVMVYDKQFTPADNQQMGGMIAGGEMLYGFGVFALLALIPTGLALWFVRNNRRFWSVFSVAALAFAIAGLAAVFTSFVAGAVEARSPLVALVCLLGVVQMLGSPLWVGGFALFAVLAPARDLRKRMLVAVGIEMTVAVLALVHFLVPALRL